MNTYIALLRGINVSGQKLIKMEELRDYLSALGLSDVQSYVQSGNIIFHFDEAPIPEIKKLLENEILKKYGFEVSCLVKKPEDLELIIKNNPFVNSGKNPERNYITLLFELPTSDSIQGLKKVTHPPEEYVLEDDIVYFYSPNGYGRAKMNNNFFEKKLKVPATTRNWKSINKLVEIAGQLNE
jgi:uncharacterized protein (DUF1697 family)